RWVTGTWLDPLPRRPSRRDSRRPGPAGMKLECLEDRCVPAGAVPSPLGFRVTDHGDGTSPPVVRTHPPVPFVVAEPNGDGALAVVPADQAVDQVVSQLRLPGTASFTPGAFQRDGRDGLISPGAVAEADLDGQYGTDLIFANSGSNNVLVYLRQ